MFVELIESLRCPRAHDDTALVASATRTEHRHIIDGVLGCPTCNAEFPIRDRVATFEPMPPTTGVEIPGEETAMRLAAFLELTDARPFALLCGRWAVHAGIVARLTETPLVLVNHPVDAPVHRVTGGGIRGRVVPFAAGTAHALAIDETAPAETIASGVRAVRPGGRVLGPVRLPVPGNVTELVRDGDVWVGEKTPAAAPPHLVPLTRR